MSDIDAAFRFVRDRIRYEAYEGVLRGPRVAFATRAGNGFDRSLVLADLVKRKGVRTRFATGTLPRGEAERLFARIFEPSPSGFAGPAHVVDPGFQLAPESIYGRIRSRATRDYMAIRTALGGRLPRGQLFPRDEVLRDISTHAWLQVLIGGRWVDLDTAFADAIPGRAYAPVEQTYDAFPDEVSQHVTVRIVAEELAEKSVREETILEFRAATQDLLDRQIFLIHVPAGGAGLAGAITNALMADSWKPMLWIDGTFYEGKPIAFVDQTQPAQRGQPPSGGLGGLFGSGGALGSAAPQLVAEWIEFELGFPYRHREITRRALVNRARASARAAGQIRPVDLFPLSRDRAGLLAPREVHNIWFTAGRHRLHDYAEALAVLSAGAQRGIDARSLQQAPFGQQFWPLAMQVFALPVLSDHLIVPSLNDSPAYRFYADAPRILIGSVRPDQQSPSGISLAIDLVRDRLRGVARDASAAAGLTDRRIWFGALEGALEHEVGAPFSVAAGGNPAAVMSTSGMLDRGPAVAFRPNEAQRARDAIRHEDRAARAVTALARGDTLVVPRATLRGGVLSWWQIKSDGETHPVLEEMNGGSFNFPAGRGWPFPWSGNRPVVRPGPPTVPGVGKPAPWPGWPSSPPQTPPASPTPQGPPGVVPGEPPITQPPITQPPITKPPGVTPAEPPLTGPTQTPFGRPAEPGRPVVRPPGNSLGPGGSEGEQERGGGGNEYFMVIKQIAQVVVLVAVTVVVEFLPVAVFWLGLWLGEALARDAGMNPR